MPRLKLVIGNKNFSSWSMRPWLVLKQSGLPFQEIKIWLDQKNTAQKIARYSPSGKVPVLIYDDLSIWDSLSIAEFIAELKPNSNLWPTHPKERALARSFAAEMHSGFHALRNQLSMDIQLKHKMGHLERSTTQDIKRISTLWQSALKSSRGPFLFGDFGIVDAFYAPVVLRFLSYGIQFKSSSIRNYIQTVLHHPHVNEWVQSAKKEKIKFEVFK